MPNLTCQVGDETIVIPNIAKIPAYRYSEEADNSGEWKTYHSKGYLRLQKKKRQNRRRTNNA